MAVSGGYRPTVHAWTHVPRVHPYAVATETRGPHALLSSPPSQRTTVSAPWKLSHLTPSTLVDGFFAHWFWVCTYNNNILLIISIVLPIALFLLPELIRVPRIRCNSNRLYFFYRTILFYVCHVSLVNLLCFPDLYHPTVCSIFTVA